MESERAVAWSELTQREQEDFGGALRPDLLEPLGLTGALGISAPDQWTACAIAIGKDRDLAEVPWERLSLSEMRGRFSGYVAKQADQSPWRISWASLPEAETARLTKTVPEKVVPEEWWDELAPAEQWARAGGEVGKGALEWKALPDEVKAFIAGQLGTEWANRAAECAEALQEGIERWPTLPQLDQWLHFCRCLDDRIEAADDGVLLLTVPLGDPMTTRTQHIRYSKSIGLCVQRVGKFEPLTRDSKVVGYQRKGEVALVGTEPPKDYLHVMALAEAKV